MRNISYCPVCTSTVTEGFCQSCGYRESLDYLKYNSLGPAVTDSIPAKEMRRRRETALIDQRVREIAGAQMDACRQELMETKDSLTAVREELAEHKKELAENQKELAEHKKKLAENQKELAEYKEKLAENQKEIAENKKELGEAIAHMNRKLLDLESELLQKLLAASKDAKDQTETVPSEAADETEPEHPESEGIDSAWMLTPDLTVHLPKETVLPISYQTYQGAFETVSFGHFPGNQEWLVLEKNGSSALLLSKYLIGQRPADHSTGRKTWENLEIRAWLNEFYLEQAFSETEKLAIETSFINNNDNPKYKTNGGANTIDKVFLFSVEDVEKYLKSAEYRKTTVQGESTLRTWMLRTPGDRTDRVAVVTRMGMTDLEGITVTKPQFFRPAVRVNLNMIKR